MSFLPYGLTMFALIIFLVALVIRVTFSLVIRVKF